MKYELNFIENLAYLKRICVISRKEALKLAKEFSEDWQYKEFEKTNECDITIRYKEKYSEVEHSLYICPELKNYGRRTQKCTQ